MHWRPHLATGVCALLVAIVCMAWGRLHEADAYWPWGLRRAEYLFVEWGWQVLGTLGLVETCAAMASKYGVRDHLVTLAAKACMVFILVVLPTLIAQVVWIEVKSK